MFKDLLGAFERRELEHGHTSIYPRGICFMYGHLDDEKSLQCFEIIFKQGKVYEEIDRICDKTYNGKIKILVRAYITKLIEKKHDYRLGWKLIIKLFSYINNEGVVADIHKAALNKLIGKDYYSEKIKNIIREINKK